MDLVEVLGMAEIRRSPRTAGAREARRRAPDGLIGVEDVCEVLRSERPLRPARDVAMALLEQALATNAGTPVSFDGRDRLLREARGALRRTGSGSIRTTSSRDHTGSGFDDLVETLSDLTGAVSDVTEAVRVLRWDGSARSPRPGVSSSNGD